MSNGLSKLGFSLYKDPKFKLLMNSNYYSVEAMQASVTALQKKGSWTGKVSKQTVNIRTMVWGDYQPELNDSAMWPTQTYQYWVQKAGEARTSLAGQPNTLPLSPVDAAVPAHKHDLLDQGVQKCFNSTPPIPMLIDVREQLSGSANAAQHDVVLDWLLDTKGNLRLLLLTMVCPLNS
jgi:hypothetical protein